MPSAFNCPAIRSKPIADARSARMRSITACSPSKYPNGFLPSQRPYFARFRIRAPRSFSTI
jgi:hypothetical protein